jgi:murein DD-endopeptidase MepM/ murein hydrolase activator NlpD
MNVKKIFHYIAWIFLSLAVVATVLDFKISKLPFINKPDQQLTFDTETIAIQSGDVIATSLSRSSFPVSDYGMVLSELKKYMDINRVSPNDFYEIRYYPQSKSWFSFSYYPANSIEFYSVKKSSEGDLFSSVETLQTSIIESKKEGAIESSLWEGMRSKGVSPEVILEFADIFAWQIDFLTDTQKGDEFKIVYEETILNKKNTVHLAIIKAAQYKSANRIYDAVFFESADGKRKGYFDLDGKSLQSLFLKAPLQYRRISSYFTGARFHPVLKYVRPHSGIDYAAPEGTPVSTIADGTVINVARDEAYGNFITVRHSNGYESSYGHLSKFASGLRKGLSVKQGQVIGYVGKTGIATGPHLDFRVRQNGRLINFLSIKQPPQATLTGEDKASFSETVSKFKAFFR